MKLGTVFFLLCGALCAQDLTGRWVGVADTTDESGKLAGTFSALHDNPKKWICDRIGAMTLTKAEAAK